MEECMTVQELYEALGNECKKGNGQNLVIAESAQDMIAIKSVGDSKHIDYFSASNDYMQLKGELL